MVIQALDPMKAAAVVQPMGEVDEVDVLTNQLRSAESIVRISVICIFANISISLRVFASAFMTIDYRL